MRSQRYVLALDQGTTSSRAILFDAQGLPVSSAQREFRQLFPQPGWVEHDPQEILAIRSATWRARRCEKVAIDPQDIVAIGITNQRETTLLWDRQTGEPLHNAIVWQDRRTAGLCAELRSAGVEDRSGRRPAS